MHYIRRSNERSHIWIPNLQDIEASSTDTFYINSASLIKTTGKDKCSDMKLALKDTARRAVCFATNWKNGFDKFQNNKSPVKANPTLLVTAFFQTTWLPTSTVK